MNAQLRELLTRIPPSPETDELQDLLLLMERKRDELKHQRDRLFAALGWAKNELVEARKHRAAADIRDILFKEKGDQP